MLYNAVCTHLGKVPRLQPAFIMWTLLLNQARQDYMHYAPAAFGWSDEQTRKYEALLLATGLVQELDGVRAVTVVPDRFISAALERCHTWDWTFQEWRSGDAPVDYGRWVAERARGAGVLTPPLFAYGRLLTEEEAWAELAKDRGFWRGFGLEFPATKRAARYTPLTDEHRPSIERVQAYANRRFGSTKQLLDAEGREVGRSGATLGRYGIIRRALVDWGFSETQLGRVIDAAAEDGWWRDKGLLDTLRVFRKHEHIERFLGEHPSAQLLKVGGVTHAEAF